MDGGECRTQNRHETTTPLYLRCAPVCSTDVDHSFLIPIILQSRGTRDLTEALPSVSHSALYSRAIAITDYEE